MAGKRKKLAFITHTSKRRRSKSPPTVKRKHLNFVYKNTGRISISESSSTVKWDVTSATENASQGASDWLNQSGAEVDLGYQECLAGMDEPPITKERQVEVGTYC